MPNTTMPKANILLVDDQPENIAVLDAILRELKENSVQARSGPEALQKFAEQEFAVVIMDIMMPEMNGLEVVRRLRDSEHGRTTPVIFLTAMVPDPQVVKEAYALGAADFLHKPLVPEVILAKVRVFVDLYRNKKEVQRQAERLSEMERERYEQALERETGLFRRLVESVSEYAICLLSPEGNVVSWNPGAERILGYPASEIVGHPWSRFFPIQAVEEGAAEEALRKAESEGKATKECWLVRKDGSRFWASINLAPMRDGACPQGS